MILCLDIETCSAAPIRNGADAYAEHPSTMVWCVSFGFQVSKDSEVELFTWTPGLDMPENILDHIEDGGLILAHNVRFEKAIWRHILAPMFGFPMPSDEQWRDTQALAVLANLPPSLEGLTSVFQGSPGKDLSGQQLMKALAVAKEDGDEGYVYPVPKDDQFERLIEYCEADVIATLYCWFRLPKFSDHELEVWLCDQRINDRGIAIDTEFVDAMAAMARRRKSQLDGRAFDLTEGECSNATGAPAIKKWVKAMGIELPVVARKNTKGEVVHSESMDKSVVASLLEDDTMPEPVRKLLNVRAEASKSTSLAKLKRVPEMISTDGRLRGALRYAIAHTGRWASSGIQVHNMPKDKRDDGHSETVRGLIRAGKLDKLSETEASPLDAMSQSLRSMIVAGPGNEFIAADYAAIEARVVAWLAGATELLETFQRGEDVYVKTAEAIGSDSRQLGKVCTLALGYGMGPVKFIDTASKSGIELTRKEAVQVRNAWKKFNAPIVQFWEDMEEACITAVDELTTVQVGPHIRVSADETCLKIHLPSGRKIRYWQPRLRRVTKQITSLDAEGEFVEHEFQTRELQFYAVGGRGMVKESTYSGKLVENVTQAVARELLAHALTVLEREGYPVVLHVHDSIVAEVPEGEGNVDEFCYYMTELPDWAIGCPVKAEGYRGRFFKG